MEPAPTPARLRRLLCAPLAALVLCLALAASASAQAPNSADRLIMWTECEGLTAQTDAELDAWKSRGVGGFVCAGQHLRGMGGTQDFTGNPDARLDTSNYTLQRKLRDSRLVERLRARGMKAYLGAYLVNYWNPSTPLADWFDDRGWSETVLPKMRDLAGAANRLGFAGVAFDHELYTQHGGAQTATWEWSYPGNGQSERAVRAMAKQRGREVMSALLSAHPGIELVAYGFEFPETWSEVVQKQVNGIDDVWGRRVDVDFWDGLSSVEGYGALRLMDATFYKGPHVGSWEAALQYNSNSTYAMLSRRLSNWEYASSRLHVSPFSWIDPGPSNWERARDPDYVAEQLRAFRKWGTGGEFANYTYDTLRAFNYEPYAAAMRAASSPAVVDSAQPDLSITTAVENGGELTLEGTARDNLAIRAVRWRSDRGGSGTATMRWRVDSGDEYSGYSWHTRWSVGAIPLQPGDNRVTVVAEDIKGLTRTVSIAVPGDGSPPRPPDTRPPDTRDNVRKPFSQRVPCARRKTRAGAKRKPSGNAKGRRRTRAAGEWRPAVRPKCVGRPKRDRAGRNV